MLIRGRTRTIKFLRESGNNIVFCKIRKGVPSFNKEKMMTKKEFGRFLGQPTGVRMRYEAKKHNKQCIIWKYPKAVV